MREIKRQENTDEFIVDSMFIGGGTPSYMRESFAESIFKAVREHFVLLPEAEITMECNPGTVDKKKLTAYYKMGVNRLSFGLQSANPRELNLLGRIHTWDDFEKNFYLAREAGFKNINVDLMSAIPEQTLASYEKTCEKVLALQPEHISAYSLIIEEGTPFYECYKDKPPVSEETDRMMYALTKQIFHQAGYERYEISNYAKPGYKCRHNLKYWSGEEYLGLGLGASSFIENCRMKNIASLSDYIRLTANEYEEITELTLEDKMEEFMFWDSEK